MGDLIYVLAFRSAILSMECLVDFVLISPFSVLVHLLCFALFYPFNGEDVSSKSLIDIDFSSRSSSSVG